PGRAVELPPPDHHEQRRDHPAPHPARPIRGHPRVRFAPRTPHPQNLTARRPILLGDSTSTHPDAPDAPAVAAELTQLRDDNLDFLHDAPVPMFVVDTATSHIVAANPAAEERYGYTVPQLLLLSWDQLVDWDAHPRVLAQRAFEDAEPVDVELT